MTTIVYCDGGCSGNGTHNATVYGSYKIGELPIERIKHADAHTNNEGEFLTMIETLRSLKELNIRDALIKCDSLLVVNQVTGRWKVKEQRLLPLMKTARELVNETGASLQWVSRDEIFAVLGH